MLNPSLKKENAVKMNYHRIPPLRSQRQHYYRARHKSIRQKSITNIFRWRRRLQRLQRRCLERHDFLKHVKHESTKNKRYHRWTIRHPYTLYRLNDRRLAARWALFKKKKYHIRRRRRLFVLPKKKLTMFNQNYSFYKSLSRRSYLLDIPRYKKSHHHYEMHQILKRSFFKRHNRWLRPVHFKLKYSRRRLKLNSFSLRRSIFKRPALRFVKRRQRKKRFRRRGQHRLQRRPKLAYFMSSSTTSSTMFKRPSTMLPNNNDYQVSLVLQKNNFWGLLFNDHHQKLKKVISAGALLGVNSGSKRATVYAASKVGDKLSSLINDEMEQLFMMSTLKSTTAGITKNVSQLLTTNKNKRYQKLTTENQLLLKQYDQLRSQRRYRPRIGIHFKLKNWSKSSRKWKEVLKSLFSKFLKYVTLRASVSFVKIRPHNGLRRKKQLRK